VNNLKKHIALVLCLFIFWGLSSTVSANVTIPLVGTEHKFGENSNANVTPVQVTSSKPVGHYFETNMPLTKYSCRCPSYSDSIGSLTMSVYQWAGTYDKTLQTTPIASKTFTNFADNATLTIVIDSLAYSGKFLVLFHNPQQTVGVWKSNGDVYSGTVSDVYVGGNVTKNVTLQATYVTGEKIMVNDVVRTPRSALNPIQAEDYDRAVGTFSTKDNSLSVDFINTVTSYADIDFGTTSPKSITMRVCPVDCGSDNGEVHVILDNPINGPKIGEFYFEYKDQVPQWETLSVDIKGTVTGVHDVYLVFGNYAYSIDWFQFSTSVAGSNYYTERLKNYTPVPDSKLTDYYSDTWTATDMMGRKLPGYETVGDYDPERQVGLFYWTSHARSNQLKAADVNSNQATIKKYLRKNPGSTEADIKNTFSWRNQDGTVGSWGKGLYEWNESIYGYYHGLDSWVMRKQMELLSSAGVDGLFFDTTNLSDTFTGGFMTLAGTLHEMRQDGIRTPQISFMLPFNASSFTTTSLHRLYQFMYSVGLYSDTWYYWDGKPIIMGYPDDLNNPSGYADIDALNAEIKEFFTFRPAQASYFTGQQRENQWPWLEVYPQHGFVPLKNSKYDYECVSVGTAQNANATGLTAMNGEDVFGRSYTYKNKHTLLSEESKYYGYNFQEQWDRAIELNPKMVFITGWNERTVGYHTEWQGVKSAFPDQYNDEYSRDIEPVKGDFKDNYYYQMVANIRKFKGVRSIPTASAEKVIKIGGAFTQFNDVQPTYYAYPGGTDTREFYAQAKKFLYYNDTGRNDIVLSKVARDSDYLYFYVKTNENLTSYTDPNWMQLFINTDRKYKTGWEGYDFAVNIEKPSGRTSAMLSYTEDGWNWKSVEKINYKCSGNQMFIRIPRETLGLEGKTVDIEFKWIDNMQNPGDIMDVYNNGDSAPIGRFAYRYTETTRYDKTPVDEPVTVSELKTNQYKHSVILGIGKTSAFAGGKQKTLDTAPEIINGKTMIPLRFFSEGFGAEVNWNDSTRTATVKLDDKTASITVGKATMTANGEEKALESPAVIKNGRTLVPMRDIAEALGKKVLWVDGGLIIAGENPETVHSYEWVQDMTEDNFGIR